MLCSNAMKTEFQKPRVARKMDTSPMKTEDWPRRCYLAHGWEMELQLIVNSCPYKRNDGEAFVSQFLDSLILCAFRPGRGTLAPQK